MAQSAGFLKSLSGGVREEQECCVKMHEIIETYQLDGQFRWIVAQKNRVRNGELYRFIAGTSHPFVFSCQSASVGSCLLFA